MGVIQVVICIFGCVRLQYECDRSECRILGSVFAVWFGGGMCFWIGGAFVHMTS